MKSSATYAGDPRHHADSPRPPAGELSEPERQRYITQARRLGEHVQRLRAENEALLRDALRLIVSERHKSGIHAASCDALRWPSFGFIHDCSCGANA